MNTQPILLVEDDENDVFFFQRSVDKAGLIISVQVARDGQEAIDYLRGRGKFARRSDYPFPSLVLLDLKLPFVMGLDVLKWIRQQSRSAPIVIILSSSRDEGDIAEAYRLGANAYLVKPAQMRDLDALVRAVSDFWLSFNVAPPMGVRPEAEDAAVAHRNFALAQSCDAGAKPAIAIHNGKNPPVTPPVAMCQVRGYV
jgi:CheY-like chemotaxis protein